jgi:hypothetical protein
MPFKLPGYSFLFERFSVQLFIFLIIAGSWLEPQKIQRDGKVMQFFFIPQGEATV